MDISCNGAKVYLFSDLFSHAVEVLVLDLLVVYKIPYSSCIFNTAVVVAWRCHIYSWFLPMSWILNLSIFLSNCRAYIYSVGYAEPPVLLYLLQCYRMPSKTRRNSGNLHRVIGEVLVLGVLVVVFKIPYSSCMWVRQDMIGVFTPCCCVSGTTCVPVIYPVQRVCACSPICCCLSGTTCAPVIVQYITTSLLLLSLWKS